MDLGQSHPFGQFAMVRYTWTDRDKSDFDDYSRPPCWIGMLDSNVPMVTMLTQNIRWGQGHYAPFEPPPSEVARQAAAPPCLLIGTPLPREFGERTAYRWVVPSEFFSKVHVGRIKFGASHSHQAMPMILAGQTDIENFIVNEEDLYDAIYPFVQGNSTIKMGLGQIEISTKGYIRTVGQFKHVGEAEFAKVVKGRDWVTDNIEAVVTEEEIQEEMALMRAEGLIE